MDSDSFKLLDPSPSSDEDEHGEGNLQVPITPQALSLTTPQ